MAMSTPNDRRCKACGVLLAKQDRDGLTIRRGDMQIVVTGNSTVSVTCYHSRCRTLNVLASESTGASKSTGASESTGTAHRPGAAQEPGVPPTLGVTS